jgi:hypothetical protein
MFIDTCHRCSESFQTIILKNNDKFMEISVGIFNLSVDVRPRPYYDYPMSRHVKDIHSKLNTNDRIVTLWTYVWYHQWQPVTVVIMHDWQKNKSHRTLSYSSVDRNNNHHHAHMSIFPIHEQILLPIELVEMILVWHFSLSLSLSLYWTDPTHRK